MRRARSGRVSAAGRRSHGRDAWARIGRRDDHPGSRVEAFARDKGCTPAQLALAWLLARGDDIVPIPGTKRRARLEENVGAVGVPLAPDEVQRLSEAVPVGAAAGERYPAPQLRFVHA